MPATLHKPRSNRRVERRTHTTKRSAAVVDSPSSLDMESRTVRATIATDTPVRIYDWDTDEEIDEILVPSGMQLPQRGKMKLRIDHRRWSSTGVIGSVFDFKIGKHAIDATLRFSRASDVQPIFDRVIERDLDSVSIGASYYLKHTKRLKVGESHTVDDVTYKATKRPALIVLRWEPSETSVVDEPADPKALIRSKFGTPRNKSLNSLERSTRKLTQSGIETMPATIRKTKRNRPTSERSRRVESDRPTKRPAKSTQRTKEDDSPAPVKRSKEKPAATDPTDELHAPKPADTLAQRNAERKRVAGIMDLVSGADNIPQKLVRKAIDAGWSVAHAGQRFFQYVQRSSQEPVKQSGNGLERAPAGHVAGGVSLEALQAAVLMRAGINLQNKAFATEAAAIMFERGNMMWLHKLNKDIEDEGKSDSEKICDIGRKFRNDHPTRTCERILALRGKTVPHDTEVMVERSFSSAYMPRVFGALVHAGIIAGYAEYADSTIGWVSTADWADFRMNQPIGIDATKGLKRHQRGTAAKDVDFTDYGEPYALARYTGKFTLDEMDIIDDQIGANQMMPAEMGKMAARLRPDLIYALLLTNANLSDGTPLFHASRNNIVASAPVSIDGLTAAETTMALQRVTDRTGGIRALNMTAGHMIVARADRANGKKATASTKVVSGSVTQIGDLNPHEGEYMLHSDARIDLGVVDPRNDTMVAGTNDNWFLAEASGQQTLQVGYRRGTGRAPQIRTRTLPNIGTWGIGWDIAHDIGVGVMIGRGLVRAKKTA